ncbi:hypothetical protein AzCIB_0049 [Azoarcus sp. CIB]|uniref:hypothetical protein n=1 Tax=Aromatoleum sp. (strain CIB) TaxID=198107 RepID=UPI0006A304AF|nr:hypothetical protein [Azoarcus sp. CIB]AKU09954.1 hypothetical protein AzCIB_0049 [Azoarcus sp. CIB]
MKSSYAVIIPTIAALVGCASPAPVAQNFPISYQKVARTAHHWDVVADDVVSQTLQEVSTKAQLQGRALIVAPARNTAFNTAFREFMITHLVTAGAQVSVCKMDVATGRGFQADGQVVEIQYDSQLIVHGNDVPNYAPGRLTALAAGVAVIRNAVFDNETNAALLAAGALSDFGLGHAARPTRTEIIVTTSITDQNRFVTRRSDIYYVPDADAQLFIQRVAQRSACPDDKPVAAAVPETNQASTDLARQNMIEREMRRVNPLWRPAPTPATAYSH